MTISETRLILMRIFQDVGISRKDNISLMQFLKTEEEAEELLNWIKDQKVMLTDQEILWKVGQILKAKKERATPEKT